ncbi:transcriptional regulator [Herbaspirillum chlorophenolicum]|uniref:Transcriptional regulator n=1 Tax=Herbaspirillum chlorophenolicum TaxID=211589 RepID=A0ABW8F1I6_9BURK
MADIKIIDDFHKISDKRGNGVLRREVWQDARGRITRYNLAYINHHLHHGDNGRVVGYDNAHGYHHRHYFRQVEAIDFINFEDIEIRFQEDWIALRGKP